MRDWMDLNGDGKIDGSEMIFAEEMLCTSREEHEALFGDAGDFEDDTKEDFEIDASGLNLQKLGEVTIEETHFYLKVICSKCLENKMN